MYSHKVSELVNNVPKIIIIESDTVLYRFHCNRSSIISAKYYRDFVHTLNE